MDCAHLHEELEQLLRKDPSRVVVAHDPHSERYWRADECLEELVMESEAIGCKEISTDPRTAKLVLFQEPTPQDKLNNYPGRYAAFRLLLIGDGQDPEVDYAELFAFYDDVPTADDTGNHAFLEISAAKSFMKSKLNTLEVR